MSVEEKNGSVVVTPNVDRIDASCAPALKEALAALIDRADDRIVVNLERVKFVDSSGLAALVAAFKRVGGRGEFVLCGVRGAVANLLQLTRIDRVLSVFDTVEEATKHIRTRR